MSYNLHMLDKLSEEHRQTLQDEAVRHRMLAALPRRTSLGRRAIGKLGVALVALGARLEQVEHRGDPLIHSISR
jgi:hypothetical protein